jgi:hypothetical protein
MPMQSNHAVALVASPAVEAEGSIEQRRCLRDDGHLLLVVEAIHVGCRFFSHVAALVREEGEQFYKDGFARQKQRGGRLR